MRRQRDPGARRRCLAAIIGKGADMVMSFAKPSRIALLAGLGAALIASATQAGAQAARSVFAGYAGSWSGGGTISTAGGAVERLRCTAGCRVEEGGATLVQNLNCASDSYKFDLRTQIEAAGTEITGRWFEATRNAQGAISGRVSGGRVEGTVTGAGFAAEFVLRERANRQQIVIRAQGGDVAEISAELARSR
jgi:hypothetical protein